VPTLPGVRTIPILTTGDSIRGYRMVGIPDGLGAFNSDGHDFTLIMNHELLATNGIARGHGSKGAFVSRWKIDRRTLEVLKGEDFTSSPEKVFLWDVAAQKYVPVPRCGSVTARVTCPSPAPSGIKARERSSAST
jgi:hypothetical protein